MFSEQFAILLLVAATQIVNQGPPPRDVAQTPVVETEHKALKRKMERGFTDVATRQEYRKQMHRKGGATPHETRIMVASN